MFTETRGWIATGILTPICLVVLSWTLVIFHSNRRKWQSKDFIISTILSQCIIKQVATFFYTLIVLLKPVEYFETYCGCVKWMITSVDIFQAATIGTLILTRLLAVRFPVQFRAMIKRTHINYHLITLGILSSCIGIASILAERVDPERDDKYCTFLPYELNPKYAFLSIVLNTFITIATVFSLFWMISSSLTRKLPMSTAKSCSTLSTVHNSSNTSRHALMTSSSDLSQGSDMSIRSQYANRGSKLDKNNYRTNSNNRKPRMGRMLMNFENSCAETGYQNGDMSGNATLGNSSTDTLLSSKQVPGYHQLLNGSKPVPGGPKYNSEASVNRWASESSYLSTSPSSTSSRAPCLTHGPSRAENLGLPTALTISLLCYLHTHAPFLVITVLGTFVPHLLPSWPFNAYLLWAGVLQDLLLPVILAIVDRNFKVWLRQMYTRQHKTPLAKHQGLDGKFRVFSSPLQSTQPMQLEGIHSEPIKFPITNGSLFTSVDGRLPIIHNYRRGQRTYGHCMSMGLPVTVRRGEMAAHLQGPQNCYQECHNIRPNNNLKLVAGNFKDISVGSDLRHFEELERGGSFRHCSNHDFQENLERSNNHLQNRIGHLNLDHLRNNSLEHSDYDDIHLDLNDYESEPIYATLSSGSCCSATTAANDDFEFYQSLNSNDNSTNGKMLISNFEIPSNKSSAHENIHNIEKISPHFENYTKEEVSETSSSNSSKQKEVHENAHAIHMDPIQLVKNGEAEYNKSSASYLNSVGVDESVSNLDRYLQLMHQEHIKDKEKLKKMGKARPQKHDMEMLVPVLESLNNLKQLHELISPQEYERGSGKSIQKTKNSPRAEKDFIAESGSELCSRKTPSMDLHQNMKHIKMFDDEDESNDTCESESNDCQNHRIYRKTQLNRRHIEPQLTRRSNRPPMNRRLLRPKRLDKTPPMSRRVLAHPQPQTALTPTCFRANIVPVLSVDSLTAALRNAGVSYLDNGDLWKHDREISGSVPDFRKVFVSDFI